MAGACNFISMPSIGRILYGYYHMQDMLYLAGFLWRMFMINSPSTWLTMASNNRRLLDDSGQLRFWKLLKIEIFMLVILKVSDVPSFNSRMGYTVTQNNFFKSREPFVIQTRDLLNRGRKIYTTPRGGTYFNAYVHIQTLLRNNMTSKIISETDLKTFNVRDYVISVK